jgi:hypothetical protein
MQRLALFPNTHLDPSRSGLCPVGETKACGGTPLDLSADTQGDHCG